MFRDICPLGQSPKKGCLVLNSTPKTSPAPLCPIPRRGLQGAATPILYICLILSSLLVGVGVTQLTLSAETALTSLIQPLSAVAILLLVIYLWRVTRTAKAAVPLLVVLGVFLTFYTGSILPAGILCGLILTVSEGSFLIAVQSKGKLAALPIIPLLAYGITAALSMDLVASLIVLLPWPAAWVLAISTRRSAASKDGPNRVGVICAASLAFGLTAAAFLALALYQGLGTLEPAVLMEAVEELRQELIIGIHTQPLPDGLTPELTAQWEEMLEYANVENAVNSAFNLLPAICTVTVFILVTVCQSVQHATLRAFGMGECVSDRVKAFEMSLISCILFLVAYLIAMGESEAVSTLAGTVAQNIVVILLPGLALAGLLRLTGNMVRKGSQNMGCLFFIVILAFLLLFVAPYVLAAVEVIGHIIQSVSSKLKLEDNNDDPFDKN